MVKAGVVDDGEEFDGFQGSGGLALVKRPSGVGGLRRRLRRGLILSLALNPRNRQKTLGILYPPLLAQRKTTTRQIWTEVLRAQEAKEWHSVEWILVYA